MGSLENELDQLFRLPPSELVAARSALAERLKRDGERESAARVKSIKRPTPAAWAINQVFFQQPSLLERALATSDTVRSLHASDGVDARQLSQAVEAQRAATQAVVDRALKLAEAAGQSTGTGLQRRVLTTVQGWLTGVGDEPPGRMTHELEPSGFGAVLSVGSAPKPLPIGQPAIAPASASAKKVQTDSAQARAAEQAASLAAAKQRLSERERQLRDARKLLQSRREAERTGREALERTQKAVREAEQALAEQQGKQQKQATELMIVQGSLADAERAAQQAEQALEQARDELDAAGQAGR